MVSPFHIEKAWGDSTENATMEDIRIAIKETMEMDDEHGAFWVIHLEHEEKVMEVHKDLELYYIMGDGQNENLVLKLDTWSEVEHFYKLFFDDKFEQLEMELRDKVNH